MFVLTGGVRTHTHTCVHTLMPASNACDASQIDPIGPIGKFATGSQLQDLQPDVLDSGASTSSC